MKTDNYQIGIEININHINAVLVFQQNKQWKINAFWQFPLPLNDNIDDINLRTILKRWQQSLPPINRVALVLPDTVASYHTIALSNLISLTPAAYYRLAQLRATSHQQVTKQAVQFDYRQHNQHLAIHLHNKTLIETYIALFAKINLTITAIDIPACALRYVATHLNISPHSILIFCQNNQMLWVCADKEMPHYGTLSYQDHQDQEKQLQQLLIKHHWPQEQCYFSGDNAEYFRQQMPIWPTQKERLFMSIPPKKTLPLIAIGLALRPWETACIK